MLRPFSIIGVLNPKYKTYEEYLDLYNSGLISREDLYTYKIRPVSFVTNETREGISVTIQTKSSRYSIKIGDKIWTSIGYRSPNATETTTFIPVLIVTSVSINADFTMEIVAIDEFAYYSQISNFIPANIGSDEFEQQRIYLFLAFGLTTTLSADDIKDLTEEKRLLKLKEESNTLNNIKFSPYNNILRLLSYLQSIIYPKMYLYNSEIESFNADKSQVSNYSMFYTSETAGGKNTISRTSLGKWENLNFAKIEEVLKKLKDNYYTNIYQSVPSTYNAAIELEDEVAAVFVEVLGDIPYVDRPVKIVDNVNLISDSLVYKNPISDKRIVKGIFTDKPLNKKTKGKIEVWYAYYKNDGSIDAYLSISATYDDKGKETKVDVKPAHPGYENIAMDTIAIGNAGILTEEARKQNVTDKLLSTNFFGYDGSLTTFNYTCNLNDILSIAFYNDARGVPYKDSSLQGRHSGLFGISYINRTYDSNGLTMEIGPRQQLAEGIDVNTYESYTIKKEE